MSDEQNDRASLLPVDAISEVQTEALTNTVVDAKGGTITKDGPSSYRLVLTESHVCGLSGYGALGDRCPACDQVASLRELMRQAEVAALNRLGSGNQASPKYSDTTRRSEAHKKGSPDA